MECKFFLLPYKAFPCFHSDDLQVSRQATMDKNYMPADLIPLLKAFWKNPQLASWRIHFVARQVSDTTTPVRDARKCSTILHSAHYHTMHTVSHSIIEKERDRQSTIPALKRATECKTFKPAEGKKKNKQKTFLKNKEN